MNERIETLAKAAGYDMINKAAMRALGFDVEKFAELIVQECIDIIAPYTVRMSRPGEEYLHPIQEIKEHFGVEE
jgi:hypothetical protein